MISPKEILDRLQKSDEKEYARLEQEIDATLVRDFTGEPVKIELTSLTMNKRVEKRLIEAYSKHWVVEPYVSNGYGEGSGLKFTKPLEYDDNPII